MGNEGERDKQRLNQVQAVQMGNLDANELNFSGISGLERDLSHDLKRKKEDGFDLLIQLNEVNEYLAKLDAMIAEIQARIDELLIQKQAAEQATQEAFDRMHELEDLLEDIKDGVSPEERKRLIELLGAKAENASAEDLAILIQLQIEKERQQGLDKTQEAEDLDAQIQVERDLMNQIKEKRTAYEAARTPEERLSIEQEIDHLSRNEKASVRSEAGTNQAFEKQLSANVSFDIPDFS